MSPTMLDLHVHVEPIVRLADDRCTARELLLRPLGGGDLLERAAKAEVDMAWVTTFALASARALLEVPGTDVHVNVTAADLHGADLARIVVDAVGVALAPRLVLEVTEHHELLATASTRRTMVELRRLGVRLAIDDFGDGWATTASVVLVEPEVIKVRLARLLEGSTARIVRQHADALGSAVVVEQVETAEDLAMVRALGFSHGQGWYWDRADRAIDVR